MTQTAILIPFAPGEPAVSTKALRYRTASRSDSTKRVIEKCWRVFNAWCQGQGYTSFPCKPDTLEAYLIHLASQGKKISTIEQYKYAINVRHRLSGLAMPGDSQVVKVTMAGIKRTHGSHQRRAAPITIAHIRSLSFQESAKALRDYALLMVMVCTGLRCSEIAALRLEHLEPAETGYRIFIPRSKGDQEGEGTYVSLVRAVNGACPVTALDAWINGACLSDGFVFRRLHRSGLTMPAGITAQTVNQIVKNAVGQLGLPTALYSAHSTRAGCATYLLEHGVPLNIVAAHLRHKHVNTTLRYDRSATARALEGVY